MNQISSSKSLDHYPVMLDKVLEICSPQKGGLFVDCTFGSGGYSSAILSSPNTKVIAIDRDLNTQKYAKDIKNKFKNRFEFHNIKFSELDKVVKKTQKVDAIIFDLGLSSLQIKNLDRGFSFNSKAKPDMRMGLNTLSGSEVINNFELQTLKDIFRIFGEESESFRIASNIIAERKKKSITLIPDLIKIIQRSKKKDFKKKINVSTKVFQAIRIFVNKEISELINGLIKATKLVNENGKIIVISFHSIEDRIVKYFFTNFSGNKSRSSRYYPENIEKKSLFKNYKNKIIRPSELEVEKNNASRSAKLRYAIRNEKDFFYPKDIEEKFINYLELERRND